jgi:N6-adenosine-specific RNA methylase IME4
VTRYRTIVADPPWDVARSFGGANWSNGDRVRPELDYPTMTTDEIAALPVADMAAKDAHLYLWTTQGYLERTYTIARAWGFRPVYSLVWCKPAGGFVGGAHYSNVEFALFCRRGTLKATNRANSQWFTWPRGRHSAKPEGFLDLVESVSPGPYLELFARRNRLGWDTWGNESLEHIEMGA